MAIPTDPPDAAALLRLLAWLSPAFPVGGFAYSHGLERAIHDGLIRDRADLAGWLADLLAHGSGWNDAVLLAAAWRDGEGEGWREVAELASALAGSRERHLETTQQGGAFADAVAVWNGAAAQDSEPLAYPVALGRAARRAGIGLEPTLLALLHGFASNLVQGAVRLVPLGQRDGVATLSGLSPLIAATAARAAASGLDDLGSACFTSEIMSLRHETQYSRVFRS